MPPHLVHFLEVLAASFLQIHHVFSQIDVYEPESGWFYLPHDVLLLGFGLMDVGVQVQKCLQHPSFSLVGPGIFIW